MSQQVVQSDLYVNGNLSSSTFTAPAASITDSMIQGAAGIQASKLQHQYEKPYSNGDAAATAVSEQRVLHVVRGATATVIEFGAGAIVPLVAPDTCTVDILKNGTSILSAAIALAAGDLARQFKTGSLSGTSAVAGDVFEVKVTATHSSGTLPKGVFAQLKIREDAQ